MSQKIYKKVVLVILDGFGVAPPSRGNAISLAEIPTLDYLVNNFPSATLQASGPLVGLPWGEMGNSEVGHLNIGAGRIVGQDQPRITMAIQSGEFFKNPALLGAVDHAKKNHASLHLIGMISDGGVHSLDEHLYALLGMAQQQKLPSVFIHMFTDGRDTEPQVALEDIKKLRDRITRLGVGTVATITGRFYGMDRGGHWSQTIMTYNALVKGQGETADSAEEAVQHNYDKQIFDEMIKPTVVISGEQKPTAVIRDNDSVIFFNFRSDRALQLAQCFATPQIIPEQVRPVVPQNLYVTTMTDYLPGLPVHVAFAQKNLKNSLAEVLSLNNFKQFHIAETEKYAHVTSFFNCGRAEQWPGEDRIIVTSPENNSKNYVDNPGMSADKLTDILVAKIAQPEINFYVANFANTDMVGHTGSLPASIKAVEAVDYCLKQISDAVLAAGAVLLVTADHGNVEQKINLKTGDIEKDHTTNPVPFLFVSRENQFTPPLSVGFEWLSQQIPSGIVSDIAPTILALLGLPRPAEMTGVSLLEAMNRQNNPS